VRRVSRLAHITCVRTQGDEEDGDERMHDSRQRVMVACTELTAEARFAGACVWRCWSLLMCDA
jgi:hypothetical protein